MRKPHIVNKLPQFIAERQHRAARAMNQVLILGASEASVLTPIRTSNLLNSQVRSVELRGDGAVVGSVGYTADYALAVHSGTTPVTFRRATAERLFLRKGFDNAQPSILGILKGALRV